ncbi:MAG TPA: DotU/TssL family secretion system protein [Paraburkholderia sp.]|uniref:DotU family type IV/VI secretion system protein n=1 Tax=Paraburkholderia sp. TaxID=1926495 RepID=UPI002B482A30|nr:DotU/TssL family secretion system protein [Paraburkholderia sp.]HKR42760.1 DotU/TssL family secretion system protein [Paraburkholderia sp.]
MLDASDPSDERLPLMRAFVVAFAFAENARLRAVAQAATAASAANAASTETSADPQRDADALATQLQSATRKLARDAMAWTGAAGEADIAAAQYAYVALLDELLLFSAWNGASVWETYPLEARIFGTRAAGERIPAAIETLLAQRDPAQRDLANVYLACLTLGFRGRLRGEAGALRHDQLRHALFAFAMQRDPEPDRLGAPLERAALAPRETRPLTQMFPDRARLALFVGGGFAVLLGISQLLWLYATAPVRPSLEQFETVSMAQVRPAQASHTSTTGMVLPRARTVRRRHPAVPPGDVQAGMSQSQDIAAAATVSTTPPATLALAARRIVTVSAQNTDEASEESPDATPRGARP